MRLNKKMIVTLTTIVMMLAISTVCVYATGDVSGVIETAWDSAFTQIKTIVNNVVFPVIDAILAIFLFVKLATSYFDYKKNNHQFEWTAPAILFISLVFSLTAPLYIWNVLA